MTATLTREKKAEMRTLLKSIIESESSTTKKRIKGAQRLAYRREVFETIEDAVYGTAYTPLDDDALTNEAYIEAVTDMYQNTGDIDLAFESVDYDDYREEVCA